MPGKWPDQTLDQAFGLPEVLVAVSTSRLSCKRAGKTRTLMPVWDSSGESQLDGVGVSAIRTAAGPKRPAVKIPQKLGSRESRLPRRFRARDLARTLLVRNFSKGMSKKIGGFFNAPAVILSQIWFLTGQGASPERPRWRGGIHDSDGSLGHRRFIRLWPNSNGYSSSGARATVACLLMNSAGTSHSR